MRRNAVVLYQLALDFGIYVPLSRLVSAEIAENKLGAFMSIVFIIIFRYHLCTMACLVVRIVFIRRGNHTHVKCHLTGIVRCDEHLRLLLRLRQRTASQYCGIATLGELHQLLDKLLLLGCRRNVMEYLVLMGTVNADSLRGSIIGNFVVECSQFRHLDEVAETLLCHDVVGDVKLEVGGLLCKDSSPRIKTANNSTHRKPI